MAGARIADKPTVVSASGTIATALHAFADSAMAARIALSKIYDEQPGAFLDRAVPVLKTDQDSPGFQYLMAFLLSKNLFRQVLFDPAVLSVEEAAGVLKATKRIEPGIEPRLVNELSTGGTALQLVRLMEILVHMPNSSSLLPLLTKLMRYPDSYVQSKAALLIGRLNQNIEWVRQRLADPDPRVRANAIESLWGETGSEALSVFEECAKSPENRLAGNAIVGMYLAGQPKALRLAAALTESTSDTARLTGYWVMSFLGDNRFQQILADSIGSSDQKSRPKIFQAIRAVKQRREQFLAAGKVRVFVSSAVQKDDGSGLVRLHAFDEATGTVYHGDCLRPTQVHIYDSGKVTLDYSMEHVAPPDGLRVLLILPWADCEAGVAERGRLLSPAAQWDVAWVGEGGETSRHSAFRAADSAAAALEKPSRPAVTLDAALEKILTGPRERPTTVIAAVGQSVTSRLLANEANLQPRGARLVVHSLMPEGGRTIGHFQMEAASRETGGMVLRYDESAPLLAQFENALISTLGGFDVHYQPPRRPDGEEPDFREAKIQLYTSGGFGETSAMLRMDLS